jgi:hypothetical protein
MMMTTPYTKEFKVTDHDGVTLTMKEFKVTDHDGVTLTMTEHYDKGDKLVKVTAHQGPYPGVDDKIHGNAEVVLGKVNDWDWETTNEGSISGAANLFFLLKYMGDRNNIYCTEGFTIEEIVAEEVYTEKDALADLQDLVEMTGDNEMAPILPSVRAILEKLKGAK